MMLSTRDCRSGTIVVRIGDARFGIRDAIPAAVAVASLIAWLWLPSDYISVRAHTQPRTSWFFWPWDRASVLGRAKFTFIP